ncbi:undecaprenyldiphospho-muramoylpentapeptide beta-N-acetylglucosaminyltransferase, partial [gut metagenome]
GTPIRQELLKGDPDAARTFCGFTDKKPVLMVIGGSLGAASVNENVRKILPQLLKDFQVVHLCGKGKTEESLNHTEGYVQFEYIKKELADLFALADVVISRAGANAICELHALRKPNLLIPLSANASRGDQILNARSFERQGYSMVMEEEEITEEKLLAAIQKLYDNRQTYIDTMEKSQTMDSIEQIISLIENCASGN